MRRHEDHVYEGICSARPPRRTSAAMNKIELARRFRSAAIVACQSVSATHLRFGRGQLEHLQVLEIPIAVTVPGPSCLC